MDQIIVTAAGPSLALHTTRDATILAYSANWASETAELEYSDNGTDWSPVVDDSGAAIVFDSNTDNAYRVPGGFDYRIDKSGSSASIRLRLVTGTTVHN